MGRYRLNSGSKAKTNTFSLYPIHMTMLNELENKLKKGRSEIIQNLIESFHELHFGKRNGGTQNLGKFEKGINYDT